MTQTPGIKTKCVRQDVAAPSRRPVRLMERSRPHRALAPQARGLRPRLRASPGDGLVTYGILAGSVGLLGFAGWKAYLYFQMEYITASMIGNHVPKSGARVLQIGGGTREVYYFPEGTVEVAIIQSATKTGLLANAGVAAKIPVRVRDSVDLSTARRFNLGTTGAYDAVVLLNKFSDVKFKPVFLQELLDVLKPNGSLIFVEKSGAILRVLDETKFFEDVQSDVALEGLNDFFVGVAKKPRDRSNKKQPNKTGFARS